MNYLVGQILDKKMKVESGLAGWEQELGLGGASSWRQVMRGGRSLQDVVLTSRAVSAENIRCVLENCECWFVVSRSSNRRMRLGTQTRRALAVSPNPRVARLTSLTNRKARQELPSWKPPVLECGEKSDCFSK